MQIVIAHPGRGDRWTITRRKDGSWGGVLRKGSGWVTTSEFGSELYGFLRNMTTEEGFRFEKGSLADVDEPAPTRQQQEATVCCKKCVGACSIPDADYCGCAFCCIYCWETKNKLGYCSICSTKTEFRYHASYEANDCFYGDGPQPKKVIATATMRENYDDYSANDVRLLS